ncbi:right-handed parallel beta-helix repeat-containing protein [Sphingomonas aestuarii]
MRLRLPLILAASLIALPAFSQSNPRPYMIEESGQSFARLQQAVDAIGARSGTIRIAPGLYRDCAVVEEGAVAFVAEVPGKSVFEGLACEDKATLVLRGERARVEGLVFTGLAVDDGNGAGIRLEEGDLAVANAMFLDSQSGILTAAFPSGSISIDRSTFAGLGKDPTGNGAHSVYVGGYGSVKVTRSRFERGVGGHYLKSRAATVEITDNSFDDSKGNDTNYLIDLPNGASGRIAGNSFAQGPNKQNYGTLITVAPEGVEHRSTGLVIENNRAWLSPQFEHRTTFVGNWSGEAVTMRGNELAERITPYEDRD